MVESNITDSKATSPIDLMSELFAAGNLMLAEHIRSTNKISIQTAALSITNLLRISDDSTTGENKEKSLLSVFHDYIPTNIIPNLSPNDSTLQRLKKWAWDICLLHEHEHKHDIEPVIKFLGDTVTALTKLMSPLTFCDSILSSNKVVRTNVGEGHNEKFSTSELEKLLVSARELKLARSLDEEVVGRLGESSTDDLALQLVKGSIESLKTFCHDDANFDRILMVHLNSCVTTGTNADYRYFTEVINAAKKKSTKLEATLIVLRSAKIPTQHHVELARTAHDEFAVLEEEKLTIKETIRLLMINSIVLRYCGDSALDIFAPCDNSHVSTLLSHLCAHVNVESSLSDALFLCESFTHLNEARAIVECMINATKPSPSNVTTVKSIFIARPSYEAMKSYSHFCLQFIDNNEDDEKCRVATRCINACLNVFRREMNQEEAYQKEFKALHKKIRRIDGLQRSFGVFPTISDLERIDKVAEIMDQLAGSGEDVRLASVFLGGAVPARGSVEQIIDVLLEGRVGDGRGAEALEKNVSALIKKKDVELLRRLLTKLNKFCVTCAEEVLVFALKLAVRVEAAIEEMTQATTKTMPTLSCGGSEDFESYVKNEDTLDYAFNILLKSDKKTAFALYKKSLSTSMKNKDFNTINNLSEVGRRVGERWGMSDFITQCVALRSNAKWWTRLDNAGVSFDPKFLTNDCGAYATKFVEAIMCGGGKEPPTVGTMHQLGLDFCAQFGVSSEVATSRFIEHLLRNRCVCDDSADGSLDTCAARYVRNALATLSSTSSRCSILRRCVIDLENDYKQTASYSLHELNLSLYHDELVELYAEAKKNNGLTAAKGTDTKITITVIREEMLRVVKRRDCLALLISFKRTVLESGSREDVINLPNYNKLFVKFPLHFGMPERRIKRAGVVKVTTTEEGSEMKVNPNKVIDDEIFDPIDEFAYFMHNNDNIFLRGICVSLGYDEGFVAGRVLQQLILAKQLPNFCAIEEVVGKLSDVDGCKLAEWCSTFYDGTVNGDDSDDSDCGNGVGGTKLKLLELSLKLALQASTEMEAENDGDLTFLSTVRRINEAVLSLRDKCIARALLRGDLQSIIMDEDVESEIFIKQMLVEGARKCARSDSMRLEGFKRAAWRVHTACDKVADEHNIDVHEICCNIAKKWVLDGDNEGDHNSDTDTDTDTDTHNDDDKDDIVAAQCAFVLSFSKPPTRLLATNMTQRNNIDNDENDANTSNTVRLIHKRVTRKPDDPATYHAKWLLNFVFERKSNDATNKFTVKNRAFSTALLLVPMTVVTSVLSRLHNYSGRPEDLRRRLNVFSVVERIAGDNDMALKFTLDLNWDLYDFAVKLWERSEKFAKVVFELIISDEDFVDSELLRRIFESESVRRDEKLRHSLCNLCTKSRDQEVRSLLQFECNNE